MHLKHVTFLLLVSFSLSLPFKTQGSSSRGWEHTCCLEDYLGFRRVSAPPETRPCGTHSRQSREWRGERERERGWRDHWSGCTLRTPHFVGGPATSAQMLVGHWSWDNKPTFSTTSKLIPRVEYHGRCHLLLSIPNFALSDGREKEEEQKRDSFQIQSRSVVTCFTMIRSSISSPSLPSPRGLSRLFATLFRGNSTGLPGCLPDCAFSWRQLPNYLDEAWRRSLTWPQKSFGIASFQSCHDFMNE